MTSARDMNEQEPVLTQLPLRTRAGGIEVVHGLRDRAGGDLGASVRACGRVGVRLQASELAIVPWQALERVSELGARHGAGSTPRLPLSPLGLRSGGGRGGAGQGR